MSDYNNPGGQRRRNRGGRNRNRSPRSYSSDTPTFKRREPEPSGFQKFLSVITFGLLGKTKPAPGPAAPPPKPREAGPIARADREARDSARREARPPRESGSTEVTNERLYVGNLSYDATESDLFELFKGSGQVKNAEVVVNTRTQRSKGFAFVTMMTVDEAKKAVADLHGREFMGRPLVVGGAKPLPEGGRREDRAPHQEREERRPVHDDDIIRPPAEDAEETENVHA
jgi:RNA recognition motif-containing protein